MSKNNKGIYGSLTKVLCPDGVRRYFRLTSPNTDRGSVQYKGKTVAGDVQALRSTCGNYPYDVLFIPDETTTNGKLFDKVGE